MNTKKIAAHIATKYNTRNPYEIAERRNVQIIQTPLKSILGYYTRYKRIQCIILKDDLPEDLARFVCAHELGHSICHATLNTQWLKQNTLFATDKIEREASSFAVELLLSDEMILEYPDYPLDTLAQMVGIPLALAGLKNFTLQCEHIF